MVSTNLKKWRRAAEEIYVHHTYVPHFFATKVVVNRYHFPSACCLRPLAYPNVPKSVSASSLHRSFIHFFFVRFTHYSYDGQRQKMERREGDPAIAPTYFLWNAFLPNRYYFEVRWGMESKCCYRMPSNVSQTPMGPCMLDEISKVPTNRSCAIVALKPSDGHQATNPAP